MSASAVDLSDNSVIQQLNSDVRLTPASLTKLAVAATALSVWPADKMFKTQLYVSGSIGNGKLSGDVYLVGAGDPSLTGDNLLALAAQFKGTGITSVGGKLIVVPAPFDSVLCETKDRCDASVRSDTAYDAPLASIGTDFGTWCVDVRPTSVGKPATITGCTTRLPIAVQGTVQTAIDNKGTALRVERATVDGNDGLARRRHDRRGHVAACLPGHVESRARRGLVAERVAARHGHRRHRRRDRQGRRVTDERVHRWDDDGSGAEGTARPACCVFRTTTSPTS